MMHCTLEAMVALIDVMAKNGHFLISFEKTETKNKILVFIEMKCHTSGGKYGDERRLAEFTSACGR